jgi:hypothetical protein
MDRDRQFNSLIEGALDDSYPDDAFYIDANAVAQPIPTRLSPNHHFDYATKQWLDPRTLLDFQTAKWLEIKRARDTQEASSFPYLGKQIDSDSRSAQRITTAVQAADAAQRAGVAFSIAWTCADNTFLTLDAAGMQGMPVALAYFANTLHERARALRAQIEAATTPAEVEAVVW